MARDHDRHPIESPQETSPEAMDADERVTRLLPPALPLGTPSPAQEGGKGNRSRTRMLFLIGIVPGCAIVQSSKWLISALPKCTIGPSSAA